MSEPLEIIYQDEDLVAVNKPSGLLVHRSMIDRHETEFALQKVRDQIGQYVYPIHRLDRPTSGVLVMGLSSENARTMSQAIAEHKVQKHYIALCRGFMPQSGVIDYPLTEQLDKIADKDASKVPEPKDAVTAFERIATATIDVEINRYPESRFSLVHLEPKHGRKHQIRRHLAHLRHPIMYDVNYGDNKYNRYFKNTDDTCRLALHALKMEIPHPRTGALLSFKANFDKSYKTMLEIAGFNPEILNNL
ncbi:tRNA pseudouridine(65) synthase TruC [Catenovulum sp. SM1970]|uniref:tRNA pseudouridine(65) synthase TruC n=1 Tax=Marinifaba aquimaris TaxID=2741323 RepID=UPI001572B5D5|nr:tRNA pseudouridine(65) synthase TruC [Marinifaba aquimaris]